MFTSLLAWHIQLHYCYKCHVLIFLKSLNNKSASAKLAKYGGPGQGTFRCLDLNYLNREVDARNEGSKGAERGKAFVTVNLLCAPQRDGKAELCAKSCYCESTGHCECVFC